MDPNHPSGDEGYIYQLCSMSLDLAADIQTRDAKLLASQDSFIEFHRRTFQELHELEKVKADKNADELRELHASLAKRVKDLAVTSDLIAAHIHKLVVSYGMLRDLNEKLYTLLREEDSAKADNTIDELTPPQASFPRRLAALQTLRYRNAYMIYDLEAAYDKLKKENKEFYLPCVQEKSTTESATAESESNSNGECSTAYGWKAAYDKLIESEKLFPPWVPVESATESATAESESSSKGESSASQP